MPLRDLRPECLQHFYNKEIQQGASARTVRYCHILLHGALAHAEKHQLVARNVSKLTERPRAVRKEMHTLTLDSLPYTFFLLNGDMELNRDRQLFI